MLCASNTMNEYCDRSTAFQLARLKSERLRILILLSVIGVVFVVRSVRTAFLYSRDNVHLWMIMSACLAMVVLYEWLMLRAVDRLFRLAGRCPALYGLQILFWRRLYLRSSLRFFLAMRLSQLIDP